jgi:hypothetical protein
MLADSISQGVGRSPLAGGTPEFPPHRFQTFHSPEQRWHRPRCSWQAANLQHSILLQKERAEPVPNPYKRRPMFVLNSGTARRIVAIRIASLSKTVN